MARTAAKKTAKRAHKPDAENHDDQADHGTAHPTAPQMSTVMSAPKPDPDRAPRTDNIGLKDRQDVDNRVNDEDDGPDKVYGIASRARWNNNGSTQELNAEAAEAEQSAADNREE
jgi:hypothetical protein